MSEDSPSQQSNLDPAARSLEQLQVYEALKAQEWVTAIDLQQHPSGIRADLATVPPLEIYGQDALLAAVKLGPEKAVQVWGLLDDTGKVDARTVFIMERADIQSPLEMVVAVAGRGPVVIGRQNKMASKRLHLPPSVSRQHLQVEVTEDGKLHLNDMHSTFGSELLVNQHPSKVPERPAIPVQQAVMEDTIVPGRQEAATSGEPFFTDRYKPVREDRAFQQLSAPYEAKLRAVQDTYQPRLQQLRQQIEQARAAGDPYTYDELSRTEKSYAHELAEARDAYEAAVKPYLAKRLEFYRNDCGAGYTQPGLLHFDRATRSIFSGRKKVGNLYFRHHNDRGVAHMNVGITLGQITLPVRFDSWAGSSGGKTNHKTGVKTTSTQHIVDLAAAMVAGKFGEAHETIELAPDPYASEGIDDPQLRGTVPMYKVIRGNHRIAAHRLLYGLNAAAPYDAISEH
jgi:hypothetical protein